MAAVVYLLVSGLAGPLHAQSGALMPAPVAQYFDASGNPLALGTLTFYTAGTTTPVDAYSDATLSTPVANPYTLTSAGRTTTPIFLSASTSYKILLKDSGGSTIWTVDNVSGGVYLARQAVAPQVITTTSTGTVNDLSLASCATSAPCILRANNATALTINGFSALTTGQTLTVISVGAGNVSLAHQNTSSTASGRLINFATSASTQLAAGAGVATYVYDGTTARFRLVSHDQGAWITSTFSAGDFAGSGSLTWTVASGDRPTMAYWLRGRSLSVIFQVATSTTGGTAAASLFIGLGQYGSYTWANSGSFARAAYAVDATTYREALINTTTSTALTIARADGSNWSNAATDSTYVYGNVTFEVQ